MIDIKDVRHDLIGMIMHINDVEKLTTLYENLEKEISTRTDVSVSLDDSTLEIRTGVTLDEIVAEQSIKQITYPEIQKIANETEWEHSLEELLAGVD